MAQQYMESLAVMVKSVDPDKKLCPIKIIKGDILTEDWWSNADIVYSSSVCFPEFLNEGICELSKKLKLGSKIISLQSFQSETPHLEILYTVKLKMTWGHQPAVIY